MAGLLELPCLSCSVSVALPELHARRRLSPGAHRFWARFVCCERVGRHLNAKGVIGRDLDTSDLRA